MKKRITISDVAEAAGVSMMTVSRALNNKEGVSEETRQRIQQISDELGYHPSAVARTLVTNRSCTLGLVMPDVANPFFSEIAKGAEDVAYKSGYNLFLVNTDEDIERERNALNSLLEKQVDGVISISSRLPDEDLKQFIDRIPYAILINRELNEIRANCATINVDDTLGAETAVMHLLNRGHKKLGFLSGPQGSISGQRRLSGYIKGLESQGIPIDSQLIHPCPPDTEGGYQATKKLLADNQGVTAILAFNDLVAYGVFQACEELDTKIPDQIEVIGFDDIPTAALMKPHLTTLRIDKLKLGVNAVETIIALISERDDYSSAQIQTPELIIRDSSPL